MSAWSEQAGACTGTKVHRCTISKPSLVVAGVRPWVKDEARDTTDSKIAALEAAGQQQTPNALDNPLIFGGTSLRVLRPILYQ